MRRACIGDGRRHIRRGPASVRGGRSCQIDWDACLANTLSTLLQGKFKKPRSPYSLASLSLTCDTYGTCPRLTGEALLDP